MLLNFQCVQHVFVVCGKTDLRKGIDGLASLIQHTYDLEVYQDAVFLFCGNRSDRFKVLYWDGDGFALFYKRLERGRYASTSHGEVSKQMSREELMMLLEGLSFKDMNRKKRYRMA